MALDDRIVFNGINGVTGEYLHPSINSQELADSISVQADQTDAGHLKSLQIFTSEAIRFDSGSEALRYGVDADKLDEAGWGVIFPQSIDPAIREALRPLLELRREQAGKVQKHHYREFSGVAGYRSGETAAQFLARHGTAPGPADPERVPYYLMIVADPETIPYSFQYQLDVQYAVGRLWFSTVAEYARYAKTVVEAETGSIRVAPSAALFGPTHRDDPATELSASELLYPLAASVTRRGRDWAVKSVIGDGATKQTLKRYLGGDLTPAVLFTASHGMGFPSDHQLQATDQGALVCQDWPGSARSPRPVPPEHYFSAADVADDARLKGLISFHFACYGAGTPRLNDYPNGLAEPTAIAKRAFVARLPQRLLGHPAGGALAVVGHVERAWGCSVRWPDAGRQIAGFEDALFALMEGCTVGMAMESLNQKYASLSSDLSVRLRNGPTDTNRLATDLLAANDARGYVVLGDPAVRLPLTIPRPFSQPAVSPVIVSSKSSADKTEKTMNIKTDEPTPTSRPAVPTPVPNTASVTVTIPLQITVSLGDAGASAVLSAQSNVSAPEPGVAPFAVTIDPDYDNREGYDPEFLGGGKLRVPLPELSPSQRADAAEVSVVDDDDDPAELKYHHFSVVFNVHRRQAFFTAVNIDGRSTFRPKREKDKWSFDPRIDRDKQLGNEFYKKPFDRGHLVRRLDPAWGRSRGIIKAANDDTFHFTNCSPQHARFNEGKNLWAGLEDFLLHKAAGERKRLTIFTGPVFKDDDPVLGGVQIPLKFWKVAAVENPSGGVSAVAFLISQEDLVRQIHSFSAEDVARLYQVSVQRVEKLTGLGFGHLRGVDTGEIDSFEIQGKGEKPLESFDQIDLSSDNPKPRG